MLACYRLAGLTVSVESMYSVVHGMCRDYRCDDDAVPDIAVSISPCDIDEERRHSRREREMEGLPPYDFPDAVLETTAVYRSIADHLPQYGRLLMHASTIAVDGGAYLFLARSGTGKSTHTALWRKMLGDRAVMVNDDKPIVSVDTPSVAYGTPWDGKHHLSSNIAVPVKALCILSRGDENKIEKISAVEACPHILQQTFRPTDPSRMSQTLVLLNKLLTTAPVFHLYCRPDIEAAQLAYSVMQ